MKRLQYAAIWLTFATSANAAIPSPPQNLVARELFRSCVLNWDAHADATVSGYRVYRATAPGGLPRRSAAIICDLQGKQLETANAPLRAGGVTVSLARGTPKLMVHVPGRL